MSKSFTIKGKEADYIVKSLIKEQTETRYEKLLKEKRRLISTIQALNNRLELVNKFLLEEKK